MIGILSLAMRHLPDTQFCHPKSLELRGHIQCKSGLLILVPTWPHRNRGNRLSWNNSAGNKKTPSITASSAENPTVHSRQRLFNLASRPWPVRVHAGQADRAKWNWRFKRRSSDKTKTIPDLILFVHRTSLFDYTVYTQKYLHLNYELV